MRPSAFVLLLVVPKCFHETAEYFRRRLEHGLELRLVHLLDILAQMRDRLLQPLCHLPSVVTRILAGCHVPLLIIKSPSVLTRDLTGPFRPMATERAPTQGRSSGRLSTAGGFGIDSR